MSKSNNIVKWSDGNNIVDSGINISSIGSGGITGRSGTFYRILDAGSQTITYTHNLGKVPTQITFFTICLAVGQYGVITYGTYNSSGNHCDGFSFLYSGSQTGGTYWTNEGNCIVCGTTNENRQSGVCGNLTSTTFDITWTKTGSPYGDTGIISWNAIA